MTASPSQRGPDDFGYASVLPDNTVAASRSEVADAEKARVLFGHRRLSILDLSDAAHQPFINAEADLVMVYNGELYNRIDLRRALVASWPR
jgi:asparagine synthase (glutamine-hydrolysing)